MNFSYLKSLSESKYFRTLSFIVFLGLVSISAILTYVKPKPPRVTLAPANSQFIYQAKNKDFSTQIGSKQSNIPIITFETRKGASATFALENSKPEKVTRTGNSITFKNTLPDTDLVYTTLPNGLKEEIILHKPTGVSEYLFNLNTVNAKPLKNGGSSYSTSFYDNHNRLQFYLEKPFAIDAKGNRTEDVQIYVRKSTENENQFQLKLTVSPSWLEAKDRAYPISIDPTIVYDTSAEFAAGTLNRIYDTGSGNSPNLTTYYQELPVDQYTVGLWHLNDASGNATDVSGNSNTLTNTSATVDTSTQLLGSAARVFSGGSQYLSNTSIAPRLSSDLTVQFWFKTSTLPGVADRIVDIAQSAAVGLQVYMSTTGLIGIDNSGGPTSSPQTTASYADGNWHHLAVTRMGTTYYLYLDANLIGTSGGTAPTYTKVYVARRSDNETYNWQGTIDELKISNTALSAEEIKLSASRRPYSVFTSDVIDLTNAGSWNPLTWSELGVSTGDGETLKDATSLVAQWNFNSTSGTTATNDAGSCGASCNGTLTNFASTGSQDAAANSGWTSANKRWGAGALMFDGSNDYITVSDNAVFSFGSGDYTVETWVYSNDTNTQLGIFGQEGGTSYPAHFLETTLNKFRWVQRKASGGNADIFDMYSNTAIQPGKWYYVALTKSSSTYSMYINGKLDNTTTSATATEDIATEWRIGSRSSTYPEYYKGVIDSMRVYKGRALSVAEIISNYNAGNIELQTRVGADTSPDDGSWEEWRPVTAESSMLTYDNYLYGTSGTNLKSYWHFDETANNTCSGGVNDSCDPVSNFDLSNAGGSTIVDGKFGKARSFNGTSNYLECTHANCGGTSDIGPSNTLFTVAGWFNTTSTAASNRVMVSKRSALGPQDGYAVYLNATHNVLCKVSDGVNSATATSTNTYNDGVWHSFVCRSNGSTLILYVDGVQVDSASTSTVGSMDNAQAFTIGAISGGGSLFFPGTIDEVRFVNGTAFTAAQALDYHTHGSTNPFTLTQSTDTVVKTEGSGSQKIQSGRSLADAFTVGLWHLNETGGTGAYIKDSTTNARNGTPTGTTTTNGIESKARLFNGTSDYITITGEGSAFSTNSYTTSLWVKESTDNAANRLILDNRDAAGDGTLLRISTTDFFECLYNSTTLAGTTAVIVNTWYHVACTSDGATLRIYVNGIQENSTAITGSIAETTDMRIGSRSFTSSLNEFPGTIDEVKVDNIARTANEISDYYRLSRDLYLNRTISSTDLSTKTSLPFYVAADRPGTYLSATIGESPYANYQPDANTVGLWHFDEQSGTTNTYIKDSSGNGNNSSAITGTTHAYGKIGKARNFNGSSFITVSDANTLDFGTGAFSVELWFRTTSNNMFFFDKRTNGGNYGGYYADINSSGYPSFGADDCTTGGCGWNGAAVATTAYNDGKWHHLAGVRVSSSVVRLYMDGVLVSENTSATSGSVDNAAAMYIGGVYNGTASYNGTLDELRLFNVALTADQIRQSYEIGVRTHNITIDFGAKLDSGNLITASNDLGFTVDATYYGLQNKGSMLFKGDKIIIRENYDGTEYIAQGTVDSVDLSTGATTVSAWDNGSTFPASGYTVNASVFKWQREFWNPAGSLSTHRDAITNLTFRLTDGNEGRTIWIDDLRSSGGYLTNPLSSTLTSSLNNRYLQYRAILTSADTGVSPSLSGVTIDYVAQTAPNTPTLDSPADAAINQSLSPVLQTTTTDGQSDYLRYKIELCTNLAMSQNCQTFDQTSSQTGWSGQDSQTATAYASGTQGTYTIQTPLAAGTTYYWRSYAIDPAGTNTWSLTQGTPRSFTTQYATAITNEVIDSADATDWVSSDTTNTPNSLETTIKTEGTGSIKVLTGNDSSSSFDLMEYTNDSNAQSAYVTNGNNTATGGTITSSGGYSIHTFTSSGTFNSSQSMGVEYLVVAGGGGGGSAYVGSGGGAGGMRTGTLSITSGAKTVTVGNGGPAQTQGENSVFDSITSIGGGAGVSMATGGDGGSGGGGSYGAGGGAGYLGGTATVGQGNNGGRGWYSVGVSVGSGGGGGAGAVGSNGNTNSSGNGGAGLASSISGASVTYAGGGGGGPWSTNGAGSGGSGGGGAGAATTGVAGTANTGGGGGGGGTTGTPVGGAGGSGIVIVRYLSNVLQSYSEATIKSQGSYSLKGVAVATESLNRTLTRTINSPIDLSNRSSFSFDIRSNRTGSNIKVGLHDAGGTTTEITPNITQADAFQTATIDLSGVANANKDAIDQIIITIVNADALNTFYIDNLVSSDLSIGDTVTKTTNYYNMTQVSNITFWIRSTVAGSYLRFGFGEAAATEQYTDITINQANTWEQVVWDVSAISAASRDGVTKFAFTVIGNTSGATFYFDDIRTNDLTAPTIGAATAISTTSIRWNFTDTTSTETGFKVYSNSSVLTTTCASQNLAYCDETGLSPNTSYTRKVAAYNSYGPGKYSSTATKYTLAAVPPAPFTFDRANTTIKIGLNDGTNPAGTLYAIYKEPRFTCDGDGGSYLAANGSDNGSTAVWQTRSQWGALVATGLSKESAYSFCVKAKNGDDVQTSFGATSVNNSGYIPLTGDAILASSSGTPFNLGSKYTEGNRGSRFISGVDNGINDNDPNTANITLQEGILVLQSNETLVAGKFLLDGGSLTISTNLQTGEKGELRPGAPLWIKDADSDGYPESDTTWFGFNDKPTGGRRRGNLSSLMTADCDETNGTLNTVCCTANGGACSSSGSCCSGSCGTDADNDGFNNQNLGQSGTCQATAKPYTDCGDGNSNAKPTPNNYCSSGTFTSTGTSNTGNQSYDWNCSGNGAAQGSTCGTAYYGASFTYRYNCNQSNMNCNQTENGVNCIGSQVGCGQVGYLPDGGYNDWYPCTNCELPSYGCNLIGTSGTQACQ